MLGESLRWLGLGVEAGVEWGWERGYNPTSLQKDVEVFFFFLSVGLVQQGLGEGQQIRSMLIKE